MLVMGGSADKVVDREGLDEASFFCGVEPPVMCEGLPHDLMLASDWEVPAGKLLAWLRILEGGPR